MTANLKTSESKEGAIDSMSSLKLLKGKTNNIQRGDLLTIAAIQLNSTADQKDMSWITIQENLLNSAFDSIDQNQKQDKKEKSKGQAKGKKSTEGKQSSLRVSASTQEDTGVKALFNVSEKLTKTKEEASKCEQQVERNQEATLESIQKNELAEAEKIQSFMNLMETYLKQNPTDKDGSGYQNFTSLMEALQAYAKDNGDTDAATFFENEASKARKAYNKEKDWEKNHDTWPWTWFWKDPHAWRNFVKNTDVFQQCIQQGLIANPQIIQDLKNNVYKSFDRLLEGLKSNVKNLGRIDEALQEKGSALFDLADIMTNLTNSAAQNSADEIKRKGAVSKANLKELEKNYKKINEDISKQIQKHNRAKSFFGAICNFFSSVVNDIAKIVHGVELISKGHKDEGWKELGEATGLGYLVESAIKLLKDVVAGNFDKIGGDLKDLGEEFETASLAFLGGPLGLMANGAGSKNGDKQDYDWIKGVGSFHGDAKGLTDMAYHALVMLSEVAVVALANIGSLGAINADKSMRETELKILKDSGQNGQAIITNPEFKLVMDLAMIAMTVATAMSGGALAAGVMGVMFLLQEQIPGTQTSVMQMATESLTKAFHGNALAADAVIMGITTAITLGTSFSTEVASAASAAASGLSSAARIAGEGASIAASRLSIAVCTRMRAVVNSAVKMATSILKSTAEGEAGLELETTFSSVEQENLAATTIQKFARSKLAYKEAGILREAKAAAVAKRAEVAAGTQDAIDTSDEETKNTINQNIKRFAAATSLGVGTGMSLTSFGTDLAKAIDPKNKELQMILGIVSEITATILAIAGGVGLSKLSNLTESVAKGRPSFFKKLMPNMDSIDERQMSRTALMFQAGATVTQSSGEVGNALQELKTAEITADLQKREATVKELDEMEKINNKKMEKEESHMQTILKGFQKKMADLQNALIAPEEAISRALSESV